MSSKAPAILIGLLVLIPCVVIAVKIQVQLDRFEQLMGFEFANASGVRVRKFNRTTSVLTGDCDVFQDVGDDYKFTLTIAHSRLGNNQFNEYPLKISKAKGCDILNGPYKEYQHLFDGYSNLPQVGDERFCPFPKGRYWMKDWAPESSWVPPVIPDGYWRFTGDVLDLEDVLVLRLVGYLHIIKELY